MKVQAAAQRVHRLSLANAYSPEKFPRGERLVVEDQPQQAFNPAKLHLDPEYMKNTEFGEPIVNSCLTLSLMVGISVNETTESTAVANLGWDEVRFPKPLFHGDTIRVETDVVDLRESKSRPDNDIVTFEHRAYNQDDELVGICKRTALMLRKPA